MPDVSTANLRLSTTLFDSTSETFTSCGWMADSNMNDMEYGKEATGKHHHWLLGFSNLGYK